MDGAGYHEVISGRARGLTPSLARAALAACVPAYRTGLFLDRLRKRPQRVATPVVSVGNLTCGGTGKTPVTAWLTRRMQAAGLRPGLLSRGYMADGDAGNDEKQVLDALCPGVTHVQAADRVSAARSLENQCDVLILDDGFQHRRLARDTDIVLIDALRPWGYGHLLPRGLLREPPSALRRADLIVLTRVDALTAASRQKLEWTVARFTDAPIATGQFRPTRLVSNRGTRVRPRDVSEVRAAAFCGLGNPAGFEATLASFGLLIPEGHFRRYPDHHAYSPRDLESLEEWAASLGVDVLVTTRKDQVKVAPSHLGRVPVMALDIEFEPVHRSELFDTVLPRGRAAA